MDISIKNGVVYVKLKPRNIAFSYAKNKHNDSVAIIIGDIDGDIDPDTGDIDFRERLFLMFDSPEFFDEFITAMRCIREHMEVSDEAN